MTSNPLVSLAPWMLRAAWSLVAILTAHLAGRFIARSVCRKLSALASRTEW